MITVSNFNEAWEIANQFLGSDYYDTNASERAGYPIFRSESEHEDYICDLGERLEVNLKEGNRTINIWVNSKNKKDNAGETKKVINKKLNDVEIASDEICADMKQSKNDFIERVKYDGDDMCLADFYRLAKRFTDKYKKLDDAYAKKQEEWFLLKEIENELYKKELI